MIQHRGVHTNARTYVCIFVSRLPVDRHPVARELKPRWRRRERGRRRSYARRRVSKVKRVPVQLNAQSICHVSGIGRVFPQFGARHPTWSLRGAVVEVLREQAECNAVPIPIVIAVAVPIQLGRDVIDTLIDPGLHP